jgi:hypothetical protein
MSEKPVSSSPAPRRRRSCARKSCIGLIILGVLVVVAALAGRAWIRSKINPDTSKRMERMETKVVTLPPDWQKPAELPSLAVVKFQNDFTTKVKLLREKYEDLLFGDYTSETLLLERMRSGLKILPEQQTSFSKLLADLQPLIEETSQSVSLPGYTAEIGMYSPSHTELFEMQVFAKLAGIKAFQQMRDGDCYHAMETAALPLRLVKRPPQARVITHLVSVAAASISAGMLQSLAEQCTDTVALRHALSMMTEYRNGVFPGDISTWHYGDIVGILREAAANGYKVDLAPQTEADYLRQSSKVLGYDYPNWLIQKYPPNDLRVVNARAQLKQINKVESDHPDQNKSLASLLKNSLWEHLSNFIGIKDPLIFLAAVTESNWNEAENHALCGIAIYDLARMRMAQRIADLTTSGTTSSTAPDLSAYLSPVPNDPFSEKPFAFSPKRREFYSVGPDKKDNLGSLIYDTTNGTYSAGDFFVRQDR